MIYRVPFVGYRQQYRNLEPEINEAVIRCMRQGDFIHRTDTREFEENFARYVGAKYGIGCGSCTGAMYLSLLALGVGRGDEIITVSHTYIATIDVIVHSGATPVLIDIGADMEMDASLIEQAITPRTKAIIPVHLDGRMCNMRKVMEVARKYRLYVIEDAAQAAGAKRDGYRAGSVGDTGCFSFYPAKVLGCYGEGGMICTSNAELADKLYLLRDHGEAPSYRRTVADNNRIHFFGQNSLLDNIQAAVLNVKLKHLDDAIQRRQEIAERYYLGLDSLLELVMPCVETGDVFQNYVIRAERRNELRRYLEEHGIETLTKWEVPNHKQPALTELHKFNLPRTESASRHVLSLPMYPELTDEQVRYVCGTIRDFYKGGKA